MPTKLRREWAAKRGQCVNCLSGKPMKDSATCIKCRQKDINRNKQWYQANKEKKRAYALKERAARIKDGRCAGCGTELHLEVDAGHLNCMNCREGIYAINY